MGIEIRISNPEKVIFPSIFFEISQKPLFNLVTSEGKNISELLTEVNFHNSPKFPKFLPIFSNCTVLPLVPQRRRQRAAQLYNSYGHTPTRLTRSVTVPTDEGGESADGHVHEQTGTSKDDLSREEHEN